MTAAAAERRCRQRAEIAAEKKFDQYFASRVLRLTLLAPDIVEAIMDGRQPEGMTLPRLMEGVWVAVTPCGSSFAPYPTTSSAP